MVLRVEMVAKSWSAYGGRSSWTVEKVRLYESGCQGAMVSRDWRVLLAVGLLGREMASRGVQVWVSRMELELVAYIVQTVHPVRIQDDSVARSPYTNRELQKKAGMVLEYGARRRALQYLEYPAWLGTIASADQNLLWKAASRLLSAQSASAAVNYQ
jgi:hypothetical protein